MSSQTASNVNPNYKELAKQIEPAIYSNNLSKIDEILKTENHLTLTQDEKEKQIFVFAVNMFINMLGMGEKTLKYLVFEYKIKEENSLNSIPDLNEKIKAMFETRKMKEELEQGLSTITQPNKKPKV